jgi:acyl-CoA synthetase (AMP-forming)/AMP-acid ligase II
LKLNSFEELDEKAVGLPIGVRVLKGYRTKQDGTQFTTMMLSASTLGIIPVVSNKEFKVRYDIFVQGKSIAQFEYMMDSTDVNNIWTSSYKDKKATPTEELFLKDTISQFFFDLQKEEKSQAVFAEYKEYFN